ncbi:putative ribosomal protein L30 [Chloropicon primus]|uniref:Large ribosomal subunit protein uL30m n=1 Tax=Chloropicon primus TaxID=1764295 RepID=A0A5B8MM48_9CHLO|nr:putative ribosomal protein L30 [Chloropicon primus]UPR00950.1 putative ribosomal protein L30 [Chloropicon primus]|mmetsp:Transcript_5104/g.15335  ORF Transcript_5104/g.15335 Transcript_5104/m.15335 type:complete len:101 (-) Transcript_5104:543-845(-)|eukprot:QDZ21728.1 putative ribosomal protein L30 [Chloropicon primus]
MSGAAVEAGKLAHHLVVKLVRGTAGKQNLHLATLKTLKLTKSGKQVVVPNTPSVRGKLDQVSHLVSIKTLEEYKDEVAERSERAQIKEPLVVRHGASKEK